MNENNHDIIDDIIPFKDETDPYLPVEPVDFKKPTKAVDFQKPTIKKNLIISSITISGKRKTVSNGFFAYCYFCFFCGKKLGLGENLSGIIKLAKKFNFKRAPHSEDYSGRRWVCKPCRDANRKKINEGFKKEKEGRSAFAS